MIKINNIEKLKVDSNKISRNVRRPSMSDTKLDLKNGMKNTLAALRARHMTFIDNWPGESGFVVLMNSDQGR